MNDVKNSPISPSDEQVREALAPAIMITATAGERLAPVVLSTTRRLDQPASRVARATLWATAHGVYEALVNGLPADDSVLNPGWTSYEWRLHVQAHEVTDQVRAGVDQVRIEATLAGGWFRGDLGFAEAKANYGDQLGFLAALEIEFTDGRRQVVATDTSWQGHTSPIVSASIYHGETIDLSQREHRELAVEMVEDDGARGVEEDAAIGWPGAQSESKPAPLRSTLIARSSPPVVRQEVLAPQRIWLSPSGRTLVDFGQNLVGWVRVRVRGNPGDTIVIRHAEVLENDELGVRPLRAARATDTFICSGGDDVFEPTLTFHGFRYVEVTGWPGFMIAAGALEAVVVHSSLVRTGWFECSHSGVNQLVSNSVWGQKGNFLDVPTDCPQRDERLGWTGDLAAYAPTAAYQFDVADFLHTWLLDLRAETENNPERVVPNVVPDVLKHAHFSSDLQAMVDGWMGPVAIWGDAAVWVPQALWTAYGDADRLAAYYPGMVMHLEGVEKRLSPSGLWDTGFQFGDWLDPDAAPHEPANAKADPGVVATACLYRSASFAAQTADLLGKPDDSARWRALADRTRAAFVEHYVSSEGIITSDCATVYALAICFDLLDADLRAKAGSRLAGLVAERGYRVTTGFAGTPYVTWALSETGHVDAAYRLLLEEGNPSWLYPVSMGATTIWERWDSMLPDGSINPGEMTSFNHYALGAVADWIYQVIGGIRPAAPGYAKVLFAPTPGPGLNHAHATLDTRHGRVECRWRRTGGGYVVDVVAPEGVPAQVRLPDGQTHEIVGGSHHFTC